MSIELRRFCPSAPVDPTEVRNATAGSKYRLDFFPADSSVPWQCGIIEAIGVGHRASAHHLLLCI
jgi:hypothetical protein